MIGRGISRSPLLRVLSNFAILFTLFAYIQTAWAEMEPAESDVDFQDVSKNLLYYEFLLSYILKLVSDVTPRQENRRRLRQPSISISFAHNLTLTG